MSMHAEEGMHVITGETQPGGRIDCADIVTGNSVVSASQLANPILLCKPHPLSCYYEICGLAIGGFGKPTTPP